MAENVNLLGGVAWSTFLGTDATGTKQYPGGYFGENRTNTESASILFGTTRCALIALSTLKINPATLTDLRLDIECLESGSWTLKNSLLIPASQAPGTLFQWGNEGLLFKGPIRMSYNWLDAGVPPNIIFAYRDLRT